MLVQGTFCRDVGAARQNSWCLYLYISISYFVSPYQRKGFRTYREVTQTLHDAYERR